MGTTLKAGRVPQIVRSRQVISKLQIVSLETRQSTEELYYVYAKGKLDSAYAAMSQASGQMKNMALWWTARELAEYMLGARKQRYKEAAGYQQPALHHQPGIPGYFCMERHVWGPGTGSDRLYPGCGIVLR